MDNSCSRKIDLMIIGAAKAGTKTLSNWLFDLPGISGHQHMEFNYFISDNEYRKGSDWALKHYYPEVKVPGILAAKSAAIMSQLDKLLRLQDHNPDCRLLVSLRNPVDRAYSAYWYARLRGWERARSFEEAVRRELSGATAEVSHWQNEIQHLERGKYAPQLVNVRKLFPDSQLHVSLTEDMFERPDVVLRFVDDALDLPLPENAMSHIVVKNAASRSRYQWLSNVLMTRIPHPGFIRTPGILNIKKKVKGKLRAWNDVSFRPPPMDPGVRKELVQFFKPYNQELEAFLGRDLSQWR